MPRGRLRRRGDRGELPRRALALVAEWAQRHGNELQANWERARREEVEKLVDITAVEVIGDYRLRLTFADGIVGAVDFTGREWRGVFEPLRDPEYFARVAVDPEGGTIAWPNGIDMAPERLYEEASRNLVQPSSATG